ncbi:MAG: hypothetical protein KO316_03180 [Methanobacterium sp.]|nr:hypothetical protein [Methanobacterium sp.]
MEKANFKWEQLIVCLLVLGMAMIITAGSSFAASEIIYVSTDGNDAWNGLSATYDPSTGNGPKATIQNAVDTVDDNGTVYVAAGTYYENLLINKDVYLIGEGPDTTIINGQQSNSVIAFYGTNMLPVTPLTLGVSGFTLTNGHASYGGGIYNNGGNLFLANSKITANSANKGGGIYNSGTSTADDLTIIDGNSPDNVYGNPVVYVTSEEISQDLLSPY